MSADLKKYIAVGLLGCWGVCAVQAQDMSPLIPPPPQLTTWDAPMEDPLSARPAVLSHAMQYPANVYSGAAAVCATADYAAQPHSPELAAQRLYERTQAGQQKSTQDDTDQQNAPEISLLLALDLGLCHNPQVRGTWSEIRLQASNVGQARAAYLPTLSAAITRQSSETSYINAGDTTARNTSGYISMSWRLLDFGARSATLESANFQLAAAVYNQSATLQQAIIDIVQAYYDAQTAKATWQARQQMTQLSEQTLASAWRRVERGAGEQNDVLQATAALARARLEETQSQGEYRKAMATLTYLVGLPANTPLILASTLEQDMGEISDPQNQAKQRALVEKALQDWLEQAKQHHPAIASARAQWQAGEANVQAVRAQSMPTVDLSAHYYRNGRPTDAVSSTRSSERNIGITLNIPLFSGFDHTYRVRAAQAQAQQQRSQMELVEQQTLLELVRAHADAQAAWQNLDAAETLYVACDQAIASAQRQFDKGAADITQLIQAQNNLVQACLQRIQAQAKWQSARLTLVVQGYAWELAGDHPPNY